MNRPRTTLFQIVLLLATAGAAPAPAPAAVESDAPGDIVVTLEPGTSIDEVNSRYGTRVLEEIPGTTTYRVRSDKPKKALKRMQRNSAIRSAKRDGRVRRQQTVGFPDDVPRVLGADESPEATYRAQLSDTGRLEALQVDSASALTESGDDVVIAVLDTGVDATHPALADRIWRNDADATVDGVDDDGDGYVDDAAGWNFVGNTPDAAPPADGEIAGHGTFIAGLIALTAPKARVMPLRVLDGDGTGSAFDAAAAVNFAAQHGARVISMSFGAEGDEVPEVLRDAIESARALGVVLVAAVGNDGDDAIPYPASDRDRVIAVGATDEKQQRASFSNYAEDGVSVWAPGVSLVSAMPGRNDDGSARYAVWSGTSFSTALVAAGCTALLSTAAVSDPEDVKNRISDNGSDNADGTGKQVNFFEAVGSVLADAGALDVYTASGLYPVTEGIDAGGYAVLRTIGEAQRLTAYGWGLGAFENYDVYVSPLSAPESFVKVNVEPAQADFCGNLKFVAADDSRPNDPTPVLPLPLDEIKYVVFVRASDGTPAIGADVDPASETVSVWAGVGLKAVAPPNDGPVPFARAWLGFDPQSEGANQAFAVASCQLRSETTYALLVNGQEVARSFSSDDGGGVGSVTFYFSTDSNEVENNGASPLSPDDTPFIYPVTRIHQVAVAEVATDGSTTPVIAGNFTGAGQKMLTRRAERAQNRAR